MQGLDFFGSPQKSPDSGLSRQPAKSSRLHCCIIPEKQDTGGKEDFQGIHLADKHQAVPHSFSSSAELESQLPEGAAWEGLEHSAFETHPEVLYFILFILILC